MCKGMRDEQEKKTGTASGDINYFAETVNDVYDETMDAYTAQRYGVQFCQRLNFTKKEIVLVKEAYPDTVPPDVRIGRWYRDFKKGRESREFGESEKSVCMNININTVATIIEDDHHLSIRAITDQFPNDSECGGDDLQPFSKQFQFFNFFSFIFW